MLVASIVYPPAVLAADPAMGSVILGSRADIPDEEISLASDIANRIAQYSSDANYTVYNWYGAQTTNDNIYRAAEGVDHKHPLTIVFYVGHGSYHNVWWSEAGKYEKQWCITNDIGGLCDDYVIHSHSNWQYVRFAFLWSCHQGEVIGGYYVTNGASRTYGMPLAWLHTTDLSKDGYASPDGQGYTFIGFNGSAPQLHVKLNNVTNAGYKFLDYFYYDALEFGYYESIKNALDYAAKNLWNCLWKDCVLHTEWNMSVYGDGSFHISNRGKSDTGGCPVLYVYDGTKYFCEGLLDIHNPEGVDVVYEHALVSTPQRVRGAYLLRLVEHPQTHSYIDQVKLYAVLKDGRLKVLPQMLNSDEWKVDTLGADHNNGTSQSIDLKFANPSPNLEIIGFMFQIEGNNQYEKR